MRKRLHRVAIVGGLFLAQAACGNGQQPSSLQAIAAVTNEGGATAATPDGAAMDATIVVLGVDGAIDGPPGGPCEAGSCGGATVLADGQHRPGAIAVDGSNLYWANQGTMAGPGGKAGQWFVNGEIKVCPVAGCSGDPVTLAGEFMGITLGTGPFGLAVSTSKVFWTTANSVDGGILTCPVGGCDAGASLLTSDHGGGIAVSNSRLYWTNYSAGTVETCATSGCGASPMTVASDQLGPNGIAADDQNVYWVATSGLWACATGGCPSGPSALWTSQSAAGVAITVDANNLYWTNGNGAVMECAKARCAATAVTIGTEHSGPGGVAVDASNVYWTDGSSVYKCSIGGCGNRPSLVSYVAHYAYAVAVDDRNVYWTDYGSGDDDGRVFAQQK